MNTRQRLNEIWSQEYIKALPHEIEDRGYCFAVNEEPKTYLITGFNPSFRENSENKGNIDFKLDFYDKKYDCYFSPVKKMMYEDGGSVDIRREAAYLDLFYFREQNQKFMQNEILKCKDGVQFTIDQLNLTQHIIEEVIQPKLIIVKNKESWAYYGKLFDEMGWVWMGYKFEFVRNMDCGELFRITGLLDSEERIAPEIKETNLNGCFVLFSQHINQYTPREKRPTARQLFDILNP